MADVVLTETDAAYAAGLFDGEGCVQLYMKPYGSKMKRKDHSLSTALSVSGTDLRPLQWLQERFDGRIKVWRPRKTGEYHRYGSKPLGRWIVFSLQAEVFGRAILPYTIVKREQLELWFEARAMLYPRGFQGTHWNGVPEHEIAQRREIVERVKELKRLG